VVVSGRAGVGKTALAVHTAHRLTGSFPDGQLYLDLGGAGPGRVDPAFALERFLSALGVDRAAPRDTLAERTALFRSHTARSRMLLLLDNAADEAQVRPLLPGAPSCAVVITSTGGLSGLEGVRRIDLGVLEPDHALELLTRIAGDHLMAADRSAAMEIVQRCGFLPLAVRIAGARLAARPHWNLRRFAERLADERLVLDELVTGDLEIRASLAAGYTRLCPKVRTVCHLLARLSVPEFTAEDCARLMPASHEVAEKVMEQLLDASLIEISAIGVAGQTKYRFTTLVRAFLRER
jgi:hypothetical protein